MHEPFVNWGLFHRGRCNDEEAAVPLPPHLNAAAFILLSYNVDVAYSYNEDINSQFFFNGLQMWNNTTTKLILVLAIVPLLVCSDDSVSFVIRLFFLEKIRENDEFRFSSNAVWEDGSRLDLWRFAGLLVVQDIKRSLRNLHWWNPWSYVPKIQKEIISKKWLNCEMTFIHIGKNDKKVLKNL